MTEEQIHQYVMTFIDAHSRGVILIGNDTHPSSTDWDINNAFYFVFTIVTTIGLNNKNWIF